MPTYIVAMRLIPARLEHYEAITLINNSYHPMDLSFITVPEIIKWLHQNHHNKHILVALDGSVVQGFFWLERREETVHVIRHAADPAIPRAHRVLPYFAHLIQEPIRNPNHPLWKKCKFIEVHLRPTNRKGRKYLVNTLGFQCKSPHQVESTFYSSGEESLVFRYQI